VEAYVEKMSKSDSSVESSDKSSPGVKANGERLKKAVRWFLIVTF